MRCCGPLAPKRSSAAPIEPYHAFGQHGEFLPHPLLPNRVTRAVRPIQSLRTDHPNRFLSSARLHLHTLPGWPCSSRGLRGRLGQGHGVRHTLGRQLSCPSGSTIWTPRAALRGGVHLERGQRPWRKRQSQDERPATFTLGSDLQRRLPMDRAGLALPAAVSPEYRLVGAGLQSP